MSLVPTWDLKVSCNLRLLPIVRQNSMSCSTQKHKTSSLCSFIHDNKEHTALLLSSAATAASTSSKNCSYISNYYNWLRRIHPCREGLLITVHSLQVPYAPRDQPLLAVVACNEASELQAPLGHLIQWLPGIAKGALLLLSEQVSRRHSCTNDHYFLSAH